MKDQVFEARDRMEKEPLNRISKETQLLPGHEESHALPSLPTSFVPVASSSSSRASSSSANFNPSIKFSVNASQEEVAGLKPIRTRSTSSVAVQQLRETDPLHIFCCCKFQRLGSLYILYEAMDDCTVNEQHHSCILIGPHWIGVVFTACLIILSTVAFLHQQAAHLGAWYILLTLVFSFTCILTLFLTACTDPGILRSNSIVTEECFRYCDICNVEQPIRTEHCEDCNVCVQGYDHHCPWMGQCIGKKNMRWFFFFNASWVIYLLFVILITLHNLDLHFKVHHHHLPTLLLNNHTSLSSTQGVNETGHGRI